MRSLLRMLAAILALGMLPVQYASAQGATAEDTVFLVANPAFRDPEYRQTVLIASPTSNGGHLRPRARRFGTSTSSRTAPRSKAGLFMSSAL